jgi:hypothetical protein
MTASDPGDKTAGRHVYGPRSLGAVLPLVTRAAYRRRSPAAAYLMTDWEAVVGPRIAAISVPRKLFAGTLSIAATGPVAMELQHVAAELMQRINAHLGGTSVSRLRFIQDFSPSQRPAAPARHAPPAEALARSGAAVAHLPEGALRDALIRLGAAVLATR